MLQALKYTNLGLAFALELAMLGASGVWAMSLGTAFWGRIAIAALVIGAAIVVWALWAAPTSSRRLPGWPLLALKVTLFAVAAAALWVPGWHGAAIAFVLLAAANFTAAGLWEQG